MERNKKTSHEEDSHIRNEKELYAKVNKTHRKGRDKLLIVSIMIAAAVMVACIVPIVMAGRFQRNYWDYISRISDATYYAYQEDCLSARMAGEEYGLPKERAYDVFRLIQGAGTGRVQKEAPAGEPDARLDYGNGTTLSVWEIPACKDSNKNRESDIFLRLEDDQGSYGYIAWEMIPASILRSCRKPAGEP